MEKRLSGFDDELGELVRNTPLWRERDELLRSVPGVGKLLSSTLLAQLPELGMLNRKQIAALAEMERKVSQLTMEVNLLKERVGSDAERATRTTRSRAILGLLDRARMSTDEACAVDLRLPFALPHHGAINAD